MDSIASLNNLSQCNTGTHIVHTKQHIMRLFSDCFEGLGKFHGEPCHIEVHPGIPLKRLHVDLDLFINKQISRNNWQKCKQQASPSHFNKYLLNCFLTEYYKRINRQTFATSKLTWLHQVYEKILYLPKYTYHRWYQYVSDRHWCQKVGQFGTP